MNALTTLANDFLLEPVYDRNIIFHFNKAHLADPTIPMWTIKVKGQTFYVHHLDSKIGFSTKETPEGRTQGSLKFRGIVQIQKINDQLIANISAKR